MGIDHMEWTKIRRLGKGSYGTVHLAVNNRNGALFAVKECHISASAKETMQLESEIQTLSKLKHENIVKYYGAMNTEDGFFMYLEYVAGGTLETCIQEIGGLDSSLVTIYGKQMLTGLAFMHDNHVIHR